MTLVSIDVESWSDCLEVVESIIAEGKDLKTVKHDVKKLHNKVLCKKLDKFRRDLEIFDLF